MRSNLLRRLIIGIALLAPTAAIANPSVAPAKPAVTAKAKPAVTAKAKAPKGKATTTARRHKRMNKSKKASPTAKRTMPATSTLAASK